MTKRSAVRDVLRFFPAGSGVAPKSRLRAYSASGSSLFGLVGTVASFAFAFVEFRLDVVHGFFGMRYDAVADRHLVALDGTFCLLGARGGPILQLVAAALEIVFEIAH